MSWKILIEHGNLGFSSAHFITLDGACEPLHGHNYGVRVEAEGDLTSDSYVIDFVTLKDIVRALCKEWDHRFLMPLRNTHLVITEPTADEWEIRVDEHTRFVLPRSSVVPLPIDNATAERLAEQLTKRIVDVLAQRGIAQQLTRLTVGVEETEMQAAFYTIELPVPAGTDSSP